MINSPPENVRQVGTKTTIHSHLHTNVKISPTKTSEHCTANDTEQNIAISDSMQSPMHRSFL